MSAGLDNPRSGGTELYVENHEHWVEAALKDRSVTESLVASAYRRATILPLRKVSGSGAEWHGGVVDADGRFIAGHVMKDGRMAAKRDITSAYPLDDGDVEIRNETVIWGGGRPLDHFGHFLIEMLGRLWYRVENPSPHLRVAFTVGDTRPQESFLEALRLTGLRDEDMIFVTKPTRFDSVIVPDNSMYLNGVMHLSHTKSVFDAMRAAVPPSKSEKLYLTRRQLPASAISRDVNEEMLEEFFVERGYEVFAPEKFTLAEQISLMAGAKEVACTLGTLSHLIAFCPDEVRVSIFLRDKSTPVPVQWSLTRMRRANVSVVDCLAPLLPTRHHTGLHYYMRTREFKRFAREQFGSGASTAATDGEPFASYTPNQLAEYMREWSSFMQSFPESHLRSLPKVTASKLFLAVSKYVAGHEPPPDTLRGIERNYDT